MSKRMCACCSATGTTVRCHYTQAHSLHAASSGPQAGSVHSHPAPRVPNNNPGPPVTVCFSPGPWSVPVIVSLWHSHPQRPPAAAAFVISPSLALQVAPWHLKGPWPHSPPRKSSQPRVRARALRVRPVRAEVQVGTQPGHQPFHVRGICAHSVKHDVMAFAMVLHTRLGHTCRAV